MQRDGDYSGKERATPVYPESHAAFVASRSAIKAFRAEEPPGLL